MRPQIVIWLPGLEMNVAVLELVWKAKQLGSNWISTPHGEPTQVSGAEQGMGTEAVAGRPAADTATAPSTTATPRMRFIRRTSSVAASNAAVAFRVSGT